MVKKNLLLDGNTDCEDYEWDDLCRELEHYMDKFNPSGLWYARVKNFGWMKREGHKRFQATKGIELLRQILPDTDCSFRIYKYRKNGFAINNSHHDSPCGAEWYYITKPSRKELEEYA